jgi:hypothetical protein
VRPPAGGSVMGMLVMPLARTALGRERMHDNHDKNKGDDDRGDKPVLHYIPSTIPARRDKSSRIPYEIGLSFERCFGGS